MTEVNTSDEYYGAELAPGKTRYYVQRRGLRWHVHCGTGTRSLGKFWRWISAHRFAGELFTAYMDGMFVGSKGRKTHD